MSNRSLALNLLLSAKEKVTGPLAAVMGGSQRTTKALREQNKALKNLQKGQSNIASFERLTSANKELDSSIAKADKRVDKLAQSLKETEKPTKRLTRDFEAAKRAAARLREKHEKNNTSLTTLREKLKGAGINTADLTGEQKRLNREMDQASGSMDRYKQKLATIHKVQARTNKITAAGGKVMNQAGKLATKGMIALGGAGYFLKTQFIDTASEFENYEAVLKVVEGSSDKARQSLNWVSEFAAETPYELAGVTEAFVQLRNYGLDPTNGLLRTLGDTSAAMNKDIMQSVEAIADAMTGENERLKEFGIRGQINGQTVNYSYSDKDGNQKNVSANKNDRKEIESTLRTIWNEKYGGAMRERSRTWSGMLSNMSDQWTRFTNLVMGAGLFDWMKEKLGGVLENINKMAADGTLQKTAEDWGNKLSVFAVGAWEVGSAIANAVGNISDFVGGGENLIYVLAGLSSAPLLASIGLFAAALGPVGLAITGIVAGVTAIVANWDKISTFFSEMFSPGEDFTNSAAGRVAQRKKARATGTGTDTGFRVTNAPPITPARQAGDGFLSIGSISIQALPGMNTEDVANSVMAKLEQKQRQAQRSRRSRMSDSD